MTTKKEFQFEDGKTVEIYNSSQQLLEVLDYDLEGNLTMQILYSYDKIGDNTERLILDEKGKQIVRLKFEFDDHGRQLKYEEYDASDGLVNYCLFEHDRPDQKIKAQWFDKNGKLTEEKLEDFI